MGRVTGAPRSLSDDDLGAEEAPEASALSAQLASPLARLEQVRG